MITNLVMIGRSPAVRAEIDGHEALLEVDTGSFELRLSPSFVKSNQISPERVTLQIGTGPKFALKPLVEDLEGEDPIPFAKNLMARSDGIVGLDVLRKFAVGFDTVSGKIAWWYGETSRPSRFKSGPARSLPRCPSSRMGVMIGTG